MKTFQTLTEMAQWKATEMHEANLSRGGVYFEGQKNDFNEKGSEIRKVEGSVNFYRVSNYDNEFNWVKLNKIQYCPVARTHVIFGDSGVIAKVSK